jgi:hypothetical protein
MPAKTSKDNAAAKAFVNDVATLARYWGDRAATSKDAAEGVAFSILVLLDGGNTASPGFLLMPTGCSEATQEYRPHYKEGVIINQTPRNYIDMHEMLQGALDSIVNNGGKPEPKD